MTSEDSTVDIEDDEEAALHFIVNVSKGDGSEMLEFSCATDGETVEVRNVRYESLADAEEDDADLLSASYPGPNYDELDEAVQEEFHRYLEARGVDHVLANPSRSSTCTRSRSCTRIGYPRCGASSGPSDGRASAHGAL